MRVTFKSKRGGFAFLIPNVAEGARIEELDDGRYAATIEFADGETFGLTTFDLSEQEA